MASDIIPPELAIAGEVPKPKTNDESSEIPDNVIKNVEQFLKWSMTATNDSRKGWADNHAFVVEGKQWSLKRPRYRFSEVINLTWANIMTETGLETDQSPKFDYIPTEASDFQFAEILNQINTANWSKPTNQGFGWQAKTQHLTFLRKINDVVHAEIGWNPKLEGGTGDVCYTVLNPLGCFWDPEAKDISQARWFIYVEGIPTTVLDAKYGTKLKTDFMPLGGQSNQKFDDYNVDRQFGPSGPTSLLTQNPIKRLKPSGEPLTLLMRCWLKDEAAENIEIDELDADKKPTGKKTFELRKKYPKGRYVEIANKRLLWDEGKDGKASTEYPHIFEDGLFPIATAKNYDYGEYMGQNEVDHQRGTQKSVNYAVSHVMDQLKMAGNPRITLTDKAADRKGKINNEPGGIDIVPSLDSIRREPGLPISGGAFNLVETMVSFQGKVSGISDAAGYGIPDTSVTSGDQADIFRTIAQTRTRLKSRSLADTLTQIGLLATSRYLEFYTDKRSFRITGKNGFPEHVEFYIDRNKIDKDGNPTAKVTRYTTDPNDPSAKMTMEKPQEFVVKGLPDVRINPGSALPFSKQLKQTEAGQAFDRGAITGESYLKAIEWPNPEQEWQKVIQEKQAMAAQQGAQQ